MPIEAYQHCPIEWLGVQVLVLPFIDPGVENVATPSASTPSYFKMRASEPIAGFKYLLTPQLELKRLSTFFYVQIEIVLVREVYAVYPRRIKAVRFCIFTLISFQIRVAMYIIHKACLVILADETEGAVGHLLVGRNVNGVVIVTVTVHIVGQHTRVIVAATP